MPEMRDEMARETTFKPAQQPVDAAQFRSLIEAYGTEPKRWPADRRDAAMAFAVTDDGRAITDKAARLDDLLARSHVGSPSSALVGRVMASGNRKAGLRRHLQRWLVGAGLIGVGVAGGVSGAVAVSIITPSQPLAITDTETAFGAVPADGTFSEEFQ